MTTMKNKFYFLAAELLGFLTFSAPVKAASFLEGYEDIPVMRGLRQIPSDTISFGNEETRLVEAMLTGSKVGFKSVKKFYVDTLPQLGWTYQGQRGNSLLFYRDGEALEIVKESAKPLNVRFTIKNQI